MLRKERHFALLAAVVLIILDAINCLSIEWRVVGGTNVKANEAPFSVSFQYKGKHYCAGSILNKNWVVTAAHCLDSKTKVLSSKLLAGSINIDVTAATVQIRLINKYVINDLYLGGTSPYDIGLVYTCNAFTWSSAVAPIALPPKDSIATGNALLYGWGSISTTDRPVYPTIMQVAKVPIITQSSCENALGSQGANVHTTNICTGPLTGGVAICTSDSGGPLVQNVNGKNVLLGIVSWGKVPCGGANSPSVYVKVSSLLAWISDQIST